MSKGWRGRTRMAVLDQQYREALRVTPGQELPKKIGQAKSSGAARGGRGASRKGRGRQS